MKKNKLLNNIVAFIIILSFFLIQISVNGFGNNINEFLHINCIPADKISSDGFNFNNFDDEIDQFQDSYGGWAAGCWNDNMFAQSFIPTMEVLTRVYLHIFLKGDPVGLNISIRSDLYGKDLSRMFLSSENIPEDVRSWREFDFQDISVIPGKTYYIVWDPIGEYEYNNTFYWCYDWVDPYIRGFSWFFKDSNTTWTVFDSEERPGIDFCFSTYGYHDPNVGPDLKCDGEIILTDIKPGNEITGNFNIKNIGFSGSELNWEISDYPNNWGQWEFLPREGENLTPVEGEQVITVRVIVPNEEKTEFTGEIEIINKDNLNDYETVMISLTTSKNKPLITHFKNVLIKNNDIFPFLRLLFDKIS